MVARSNSGSVQQSASGGAVHLLLGGFTLAAVAVAVTVGAREDKVEPQESGFASNAVAAQEKHTHVAAEGGEVNDAAGVGKLAAGSRPEVESIYLVANERDASELRRGLQEADAVRRQAGQLPLPYEVVVVAEDVQGFARLYQVDVLDGWNVHEGLPAIVVIDLR